MASCLNCSHPLRVSKNTSKLDPEHFVSEMNGMHNWMDYYYIVIFQLTIHATPPSHPQKQINPNKILPPKLQKLLFTIKAARSIEWVLTHGASWGVYPLCFGHRGKDCEETLFPPSLWYMNILWKETFLHWLAGRAATMPEYCDLGFIRAGFRFNLWSLYQIGALALEI